MPGNPMQLAEDLGINVLFTSLPDNIKGLYYYETGIPPAIFLDESLRDNEYLLRMVLAEELGHYYTTRQGNHLPVATIKGYRDYLNISKEEFKAVAWAAKYLMPLNEIIDCLENGIQETYLLAEHFKVTEAFINFRLGMNDVQEVQRKHQELFI